MKIVICTMPIRPTPTDFPPFGSMQVISALRKAGYDPQFYDIDAQRPSFEQVEAYFTKAQPDVLGISAVVSTAYAYTKKLSRMVRRVSPKTRIVLGGNLAASAEILHRLAGIDYCAAGEGELVSVNLMNYLKDRLERGLSGDDYEKLKTIKGLTYLDEKGEMTFTGYEFKIGAEEFEVPDYSILEQFSDIKLYVNEPTVRPDFMADPRTFEPHRKGKKMATLLTSKGCVARCTFCHRWDKGYRAWPTETIMKTVKYLIERYNVGYFQVGDENFGSDKRQINEFIEAIKPYDVLYDVAGVRVRTVEPTLLKRLRESGCVAAYYGMETGSPRILEVMEKNISLEQSINGARWTKEAGLFTVYQLVLGMPGENHETIGETIEFLKKTTEILEEPPVRKLSINFIQALPGTPVYEYARFKCLLGKSLKEEEAYLELDSDVEAADDTKFINFTDWDYLTVQSWRRRIILECTAHYRKVRNLPPPSVMEIYQHTLLRYISPKRYEALKAEAAAKDGLDYNTGGYFNLQRSLFYDVISAYLYPIRTPLLWLWLLVREYKRLGPATFAGHVWEALKRRIAGPSHDAFADYRSLRKVVDGVTPAPAGPTEAAMAPLRAGR
ncbi:MAG: B12-binding domain-containing radical SAM protein [Elusimicrobia bacterium]|nr:B12-binding domain-containing radical SAM protein [Elusimicrobiota bacterium]